MAFVLLVAGKRVATFHRAARCTDKMLMFFELTSQEIFSLIEALWPPGLGKKNTCLSKFSPSHHESMTRRMYLSLQQREQMLIIILECSERFPDLLKHGDQGAHLVLYHCIAVSTLNSEHE